MSRKKLSKGKAMPISGIPLAGATTQVEDSSVEPNRDEARNAFREDDDNLDTRDYAHRDYISDELDRIGGDGAYIADKENDNWSVGLEDEANPPEDFSDEAIYPEVQPLHVDLGAIAGQGEDDDADMQLDPDTMDNETDDFTDVEITPDKMQRKKSA